MNQELIKSAQAQNSRTPVAYALGILLAVSFSFPMNFIGITTSPANAAPAPLPKPIFNEVAKYMISHDGDISADLIAKIKKHLKTPFTEKKLEAFMSKLETVLEGMGSNIEYSDRGSTEWNTGVRAICRLD